ncbi:MAG: DUF4422 domain-containing protein [Eubacteriales bacterium]|nr:DUF4422 domain-containing protein [Eubacteriales bacterium]
MSTKIYTMTHKKFNPPDDPTYVPLHVGRAKADDLGYPGDDTGDNISELNCYYGELTGLYWMWKNLPDEGNVGVCHYRRFFLKDSTHIMSEPDFEKILSEYDIITSRAFYAENNYRDYYGAAHPVGDLDLTGEVIKQMYPEDYPVFQEVMAQPKYYFGNLCVTSKKIFDGYCEWLFSIFFELEKHLDLTGYDVYQTRIFGFLSEELLLVYIKARGLSCYECPIGLTEEKAETKELKLAVGQLLKMGELNSAIEMFNEVLKVRPDIALDNSDITKEIPIIEQILFICREEEKRGIGQSGMYAYSHDLRELIGHIKTLRQILNNYRAFSKEDIAYFIKTNTSAIAVDVVASNCDELKDKEQDIFESFIKLTNQR